MGAMLSPDIRGLVQPYESTEQAGNIVRVVGYGNDIADPVAYAACLQMRGDVYRSLGWLAQDQLTETGAERPDEIDARSLHLICEDAAGEIIGTSRWTPGGPEGGMPVQQHFDIEPDSTCFELSRIIAQVPRSRMLQKKVATELIGMTFRFSRQTGFPVFGMQCEANVPLYAKKGVVLVPIGEPKPIAAFDGDVNGPYELDLDASLNMSTAVSAEQKYNRALWNRMVEAV